MTSKTIRSGRIDPEALPGQVEERHGRDHLHVDPPIGAQQLHSPLRDRRRARHRVQDLAVDGRRVNQPLDHAGVDVLYRRGLLVEGVEGDRRLDQPRARMPPGAHEADVDGSDGLGRGYGHEPRVARPQADDHDPPGHVVGLELCGWEGGTTCDCCHEP